MPSSPTNNYQLETKNSAVPACQHIKANGMRCGSPAMHHGAFCYFHTDARLRRKHKRMPLPIMEDANSVQVALNQMAARIMDDSMDLKRSGQLLYLLQISAQNVANTRFEQLMSSLRAALVRDYTPAMEAELQALPGGVPTPAMDADFQEMKQAVEEMRLQQSAKKLPVGAVPSTQPMPRDSERRP